MKRLVIVITALLLVINILAGLVFPGFRLFNVILTSIIILITGGLVFLLYNVGLKDAFSISLSFLFLILGGAEYVLGLLSPSSFRGNTILFVTILLIVAEVTFISIAQIISKKQ